MIHALLEAAPDAMIVVSHGGEILYLNNQTQTLFGYSREELVGKPIEVLVPARLRARHVQHTTNYLAAPRLRPMGLGMELMGQHKQGHEIPVELSLSPVNTKEGPQVIAAIRDVTARKQADEERSRLRAEAAARAEAEAAHRRFAFLAEASVILSSSLDFQATLSSLASLVVPYLADWVSMHVLEEDQSVRLLASTHLDPNQAEKVIELHQTCPPTSGAPNGMFSVLKTGVPELYPDVSDELLITLTNDDRHLSLLRNVGLRSAIFLPLEARGKTLGAMIFARVQSDRRYDSSDLELARDLARRVSLAFENAKNFSEVQRLNEELEYRVKARTTELETALKELESFSYAVSHDLRTPLRTIHGFSAALLEDFAHYWHGDAKEYLAHIQTASRHMSELIDALLHLARITRQELYTEPINLSSTARSIFAGLQATQPGRVVHCTAPDSVMAIGDPRLLRVVLENLIGNSWKFTSKSEEAHIQFGMVQQDDTPVYFVRDNGVGFDQAYADKLFGAFQRLHRPGEFEGHGIGLATVARIIRRHRGRVWGKGAVDLGATFFFTLGNGKGSSFAKG